MNTRAKTTQDYSKKTNQELTEMLESINKTINPETSVPLPHTQVNSIQLEGLAISAVLEERKREEQFSSSQGILEYLAQARKDFDAIGDKLDHTNPEAAEVASEAYKAILKLSRMMRTAISDEAKASQG